jgi:hypothetical protein
MKVIYQLTCSDFPNSLVEAIVLLVEGPNLLKQLAVGHGPDLGYGLLALVVAGLGEP